MRHLFVAMAVVGAAASVNAGDAGAPLSRAPGLYEAPEGGPGETAKTPAVLGGAAPRLTALRVVKGNPVQFRPGSVYVIDFWATWCTPCQSTIPHLTSLHLKYKDRNVAFVGISDEGTDKVLPFVEKMGPSMSYTVATDPQSAVSDSYLKPFYVATLPHTFIVDQKGRLAWHGHPMGGLDEMIAAVLDGGFDIGEHLARQAAEQEQTAKAGVHYRNYFETLRRKGSQAARPEGIRLLYAAPAKLLNTFAWEIITDIAPDQRDLSLAVRAAARANLLTGAQESAYLDTYALALFRAGRIDQAIRYESRAMQVVKDNPNRRAQLSQMLEAYTRIRDESKFVSIVGQQAPAWGVKVWDNLPRGKQGLEPGDFSGKVVVLFFFQAMCPASRSHGLPTLRKLAGQYVDRNKVAFVAVQTVFGNAEDNTHQAGLDLIGSTGLKIPCGRTEGSPVPAIMGRYHARGTPTTIIIGPDGVVHCCELLIEPEQSQLIIDELLSAAPAGN